MHNGSSLLSPFIFFPPFFSPPVPLSLTCVITLASSLDNPTDPIFKIGSYLRKDTLLIGLLCGPKANLLPQHHLK